MSFQFDFMSDDNEQSQSNDLVLELQPEIGQAQAIVVIDSSSLINSSNTVFKSISLKNDLVIQIIEDRTYSDINTLSIVDGVYEGGGELWECSVDLANYLLDKFSVNKTLPLSFLELGCGFGLPGLVACKSNISTVWMSDYNVDVIQKITLPNIVANNSTEQCRCIAGDWIDMIAYFQTKDNSIAFDVIVGAEVTYSIESTEKVCESTAILRVRTFLLLLLGLFFWF